MTVVYALRDSLSRGILCMYTHPMLHTVTTGLCTVVPVAPVPVGNCVGTWFVSFVWLG
jgi:hypothetical protein